MKTKYAKDTLQAFKKIISQQNTPEKLWLINEQNMGELSKNSARKNIEVHSTMNET